ncbi:hypothetical protein ABL840_28090 [Variovorax sp. NFACC27]|uniref:hypothetical protein n=1 Tax=unclassified Variovorax TaxID=663243 RepID=UPI00089BDB13|nr:hypothetical protein [Variovorax paradoxus]SEF30346.1 hypothetical protein SAMN03159371_04752 [Variovorax sp. NFACC28]SEG86719.1 hypothetical protein SAMN03159365_04753 [Variovorax sp. NFACC29]SFD31455.1 hypothetical protein SAMN03159379_04911 [Variovorax sp. NFACC26]SFG31898.1 hypothetical protein SAMN03159447_02752 [Variovorax sp. NFACC27]
MNNRTFRTLAGISVAGMLAAGTGLVHAQQNQVVQARVISATPIRETTGSDVNYNVTYEYNGRQYTTRMNTRPGATIPIQASAYGVTGVTTSPVVPQSQLQAYPVEANSGGYAPQSGGSPWDNVVPEPGVVVSNAPAPVYQPAPVYAAPVYSAPVYVEPAYTYPYAYPYAYPPVGISLNLGYSRGWGGGYYRGGWGYRGWHR